MTASPSFLGFPDRLADGRMPRAVIFGPGHGSTYPGKDSSGYVLAAGAIRSASQDDALLVEHWDFDLGGPLFDGKPVCCADAGNILTIMQDSRQPCADRGEDARGPGSTCRADPARR